ncbi:MAG: nucleotide exchange factor GrpE [Rhodospirillales bacterium]
MTINQIADEDIPEELPQDEEDTDAPEEVSEELLDEDLADLSAVSDEPDPADVDDEAEEGEGVEDAEKLPLTYEDLESEITALKDQLLRALAEAQNVRRRTEREKTDMSKYAITNFARQIVSVADNLARALSSVSEDARGDNEELNNLFVGIEMTEKELMNIFEQSGIKVVEAIGQKFDHSIHQAMFEVEDLDQPAGLVIQEMQKGYVLHDRLLRPAMVGVSKGGPKLEENGDAETPIEPPKEQAATESSSAYEKQSDAADQVADGGDSQLDKEL